MKEKEKLKKDIIQKKRNKRAKIKNKRFDVRKSGWKKIRINKLTLSIIKNKKMK